MSRIKFEGTCMQCGREGLWGKRERLCSVCFDRKHYLRKTEAENFREKECSRSKNYRHRNRAQYIINQLKSKSRRIGINVDISHDWIDERLQYGFCELTGLPFEWKDYTRNQRGGRLFYTPSIERIDNKRGYTPNNCRIVISGYNVGKSDYTDREMTAMSVALVANSLSEKNRKEFIELLPPNLIATLPKETNWLN
ncbi:MAG: hypothetical protein HND53_00025 [Proteobacteria bacterium]|nr:hypothetical protein [Pseudomonadota bacterium]NOG58861.1 hypothetical protein [Pseudomonadota bacterium]